MTKLRSLKKGSIRSLILAGIVLVSLTSCSKKGHLCDAYKGCGNAKVKHHR